MKKVLMLFVLALSLNATSVHSRVHVRHVGPKKTLTEEEKKTQRTREYIFGTIGVVILGFIFYYGNKKK